MEQNQIMTVKGSIDPEELGFCHSHEHLFLADGESAKLNSALRLDDFNKTVNELKLFKEIGGSSIVDAQPVGCGRMTDYLHVASYSSDVNIIASTGFHKLEFYPKNHWIHSIDTEELINLYVSELLEGMYIDGDNDLPKHKIGSKAGIIKAASDAKGLHDRYYDLFTAAAIASKRTGSSILTHTEMGQGALEQIEILAKNGVSPDSIIICHLDRTVKDISYHLEVAKTGVYMEFDTIGRFKYHSDEDEAKFIVSLVEKGYENKILIGLDTTRERMKSYGGSIGLDYISKTFMPLLKDFGLSDEIINKFVIANPAKAFVNKKTKILTTYHTQFLNRFKMKGMLFMNLPEKATQPTMYFIGVTTEKSSIMKLFPRWAKALGLKDAVIKGIDLPIHADPADYRRVVEFIKNDALSLGALVTTHKIDLYNAAKDMFEYLDPYAQMFGELSSISKKDGRLEGYAKDPISSGLALEAFLPKNYWKDYNGEVFVLGAGGSAISISAYMLNNDKGDNMPSKIIVGNRTAPRLEEIKHIIKTVNPDVPAEFHLTPDAKISDEIVKNLKPHSLIINATGLGKDRPGSPLTDECEYPIDSYVWEFNYRGELDFMHQALKHKEEKNLYVEDGWIYFIHGWTQVIAEVFHIDITGKVLDECISIADDMRTNG